MMKIFGMELKPLPLFLLILGGCEVSPDITPENLDWSIDTDYLRQGCFSGKDCIPSLENPPRSPVGGEDLEYLDDGDLVVGVWDGKEYSAYPHPILDWHEIVNEDGFTISYCPLTGSAIHLKAEGNYGVSGLLYNSNLIMYDRSTGSYWPQMLLQSDAGSLKGTELELKPLVETRWGVWRRLFPETKVISANTGYSRNYSHYPYGSYKSCNYTTCGDYIYSPHHPGRDSPRVSPQTVTDQGIDDQVGGLKQTQGIAAAGHYGPKRQLLKGFPGTGWGMEPGPAVDRVALAVKGYNGRQRSYPQFPGQLEPLRRLNVDLDGDKIPQGGLNSGIGERFLIHLMTEMAPVGVEIHQDRQSLLAALFQGSG